MNRFGTRDRDRAVAVWMFLAAFLVFAMVVVGGATRLTGSGLSITEWKPIMGALPPMTQADWLEAFEKYKAIPQYTQVNAGADGARFATSSSATIITERPFSFFGSGRQVCVGCGKARLFTPAETSFGFDMLLMSRMKMPWCQ